MMGILADARAGLSELGIDSQGLALRLPLIFMLSHVNLREYDFSEEKLQDTVGIQPPKLTP